jgi:hypothetical protein
MAWGFGLAMVIGLGIGGLCWFLAWLTTEGRWPR